MSRIDEIKYQLPDIRKVLEADASLAICVQREMLSHIDYLLSCIESRGVEDAQRWMRGTPTADGYYWMRFFDPASEAMIVEVKQNRVIETGLAGDIRNRVEIDCCEFLGPLIPPTPTAGGERCAENHVFTCVRCSRQWTVVSNDELECFFSGFCYWCLRETGTTQDEVKAALITTAQRLGVKWRRPNTTEILECDGLTPEQLAFRIRGVIRMCGSVELLALTPCVFPAPPDACVRCGGDFASTGGRPNDGSGVCQKCRSEEVFPILPDSLVLAENEARDSTYRDRFIAPTPVPAETAAQDDGSMTETQLKRAALIAESRGIDLETAQELVYLRDRLSSAATEAAREIAGLVYLPRGRDSYEIEITAIISKHFPTTEAAVPAGAHHYFCSCGGALTAEEYIEHYFEKGHDRGGLGLK